MVARSGVRPDDDTSIAVSAKTGQGLDQLRAKIVATLTAGEDLRDTPAITNARHAALVTTALEVCRASESWLAAGASEELLLADLGAARRALEEVTGRRDDEDLLCGTSSRPFASGSRRRAEGVEADLSGGFDVIVTVQAMPASKPRGPRLALGCSVGLCTLSTDTVALMPCNPAIGGTAKGSPRPRDRRARRADGPRHRRDRRFSSSC